jgi:hypothetical protein
MATRLPSRKSGSEKAPCPRAASMSTPSSLGVHVHGQARAAERPQDHLTVVDERERDGVLLGAQEALGAVDGIERPVRAAGAAARVERWRVAAEVDEAQHVFLAELRAEHPAGVLDHLGTARGGVVAAQVGGVLFAHHGAHGRAGPRERGGHHGLRREVRHGDGALVALLERAGVHEVRLHRAGHEGGGPHGTTRVLELGREIEGLAGGHATGR